MHKSPKINYCIIIYRGNIKKNEFPHEILQTKKNFFFGTFVYMPCAITIVTSFIFSFILLFFSFLFFGRRFIWGFMVKIKGCKTSTHRRKERINVTRNCTRFFSSFIFPTLEYYLYFFFLFFFGEVNDRWPIFILFYFFFVSKKMFFFFMCNYASSLINFYVCFSYCVIL